MKKSDFRKHKLEYIDSCKVIVRDEGRCSWAKQSILCNECPFGVNNSVQHLGCRDNGYKSSQIYY